MTVRTTVRDLAVIMSSYFETRKRSDGSEFTTLRRRRLPWMQHVVRFCHADLLPDDWKYRFIRDAIDALANHEAIEAARASLQPKKYAAELPCWLHSGVRNRIAYIDDALAKRGEDDSFEDVIQSALAAEQAEVFGLVVAALETVAAKEEP